MEVRERDLGGRDQVEVAVAGRGLEEIAFELGQLPGARQRLGGHQVRRDHLGVAAPAVQVEHELRERALEPGARGPVDGEARAGEAGGTLEVENPELETELDVVLRREVERARLTHAA